MFARGRFFMTTAKVLGQFVRVGSDVGVIVGYYGMPDVPEDHYAIWYGQLAADGVTPSARTVPVEHCVLVDKHEFYH
jgi:hypothetical protein